MPNRFEQKEMVAAPGEDGRVRHIKKVSEDLVERKALGMHAVFVYQSKDVPRSAPVCSTFEVFFVCGVVLFVCSGLRFVCVSNVKRL